MTDPTNQNEAGEVASSKVEQQAPEVSAANTPVAAAPSPEPGGEKSAKAPKEAKAVPKEKKEKGPSVEDKPFADFIQQDYFPALQATLSKQGVKDLKLALANQKILVSGFSQEPPCWQVIGSWENGNRQFNLYFFKEDIQGQRAFSCADYGTKPSTLEPFLIDERKVSLDLLVFGTMQRLNGQKWLVRN